jgi:hypothetical protein
MSDDDGVKNDFAAQAAQEERTSLVSEFIEFLGQNKKWWLAPIIISVLLLVSLVLLGGTEAENLIYTKYYKS